MEASALKRASRHGLLARKSPFARLQKDEHLVAMVREGDASAFETIVDRYQGRLLGFCRQMLRSTEDAEDVLQEVFVNAYKAMVADNREINLRPWLYRIARNRCLNHLRKPTADAKESMDMVPMMDEASTAETVHNREEFRQLLDDVGKLPETQRTALLLREMDSLSYDDIAETMDTTVPSVKSLLVRARMSLSEASEARLLSCEEVRLSLAEAAEGITKISGSMRKHIRECDECERFRKQLRTDSKALATIFPAGPLIALKATLLGHLSGLFGGGGTGSGAAGAGSSAAGAATGSGVAGAGAAGTSVGTAGAATGAAATAGGAAAGGVAAGGAASAAGAAAIGAGGGAMGGALGAKAVAGVMTAAVITAGAVEVNNRDSTEPVASSESAIVRQVEDPPPRAPAVVPISERTNTEEDRSAAGEEATLSSAEEPSDDSTSATNGETEDLATDSAQAEASADEESASGAPEDGSKKESTDASTGHGSSAERREAAVAVGDDPNSEVVTSEASHEGEVIGDEADEKSAPDSPSGPADEPAETSDPVEEPAEEPADDPVEESADPVDEPSEPVGDPPADPVEEPSETEPQNEPAEPAEESTDAPADAGAPAEDPAAVQAE